MVIQPSFSNEIEDATFLYNEAIDQYKQENVEKSVELFKKAIELRPDFYEAHYNLAQILMSIEKNDDALKSLEEIAKLKPQDSETFYNLGKIYYKKGYLSKAHANLSKIPQGTPQYESARILIAKIEKRQLELNLESKINEHKNIVDTQGKLKGINLEEVIAPSGIALDSLGNIYVASFSENKIYKISIYGQKTVFSNSTMIKGPIGLAVDKNNNVYVANYSANNIVKITPDNTIVSIFADIQRPYCLIYDEVRNRLYATEQNTNKLVKFDL